MNEYEASFGLVCGHDHMSSGKNGHDGVDLIEHEDHIVAVVSDGCGSSINSEVGSKIAAKLVAKEIHSELLDLGDKPLSHVLNNVYRKTLWTLSGLAASIDSENPKEVIDQFMLFTLVVAIITKGSTTVVSIGDGFYAINDEITEIGPFPNNAPPYIMYGALYPNRGIGNGWTYNFDGMTKDIDSLMIATDGLTYLENSKKLIPGTDKEFGDISQFWKEDKYFKNKDMIRRRLFLVSKGKPSNPGFLHDDLALISIRRKIK